MRRPRPQLVVDNSEKYLPMPYPFQMVTLAEKEAADRALTAMVVLGLTGIMIAPILCAQLAIRMFAIWE